MIHPTAIVHSKAKVPASVHIGPFSVIDEGVELGADCVLGPHVYITGATTVGARNRFHAGCIIGDAPQDLKYRDEPTRLRIGDDNVFREHFTAHRSNKLGEDTVIGSHNFFMQHSHVGHNCLIGNHVIVASNSLLGGHVTVQDRAFISGLAGVHQFCRVGTLSIMQGGSILTQDLCPFAVHRGTNIMCGLNIVGLRRAGYNAAQRLELKQLYRVLFRSGENLRAAVAGAKEIFTSAPCKLVLDFVASTKRGICPDISRCRTADDPAGQE